MQNCRVKCRRKFAFAKLQILVVYKVKSQIFDASYFNTFCCCWYFQYYGGASLLCTQAINIFFGKNMSVSFLNIPPDKKISNILFKKCAIAAWGLLCARLASIYNADIISYQNRQKETIRARGSWNFMIYPNKSN